MKTFKTILISLFSLVIVVCDCGAVIIFRIKHEAIPQYKGDLVAPGLVSDVTVYRDERGMPHIYATNEHDLYFSVGYVTAQERLWFMDLIRRATTGRLSEVFGDKLVETDKFSRCLKMTEKSKMLLGREDPAILSYMQAYADGVNALHYSCREKTSA